MRNRLCLWVVPALICPLQGQGLSDAFKALNQGWDAALAQGHGALVRQKAEELLNREGQAVSRADYNEMRVLVALRGYAAKACVLEGDWENAIKHLEGASGAATENLTAAETTFARIRREHETKLTEWKDAVKKQTDNLQKLENQPGLTEEQMRYRNQLKAFLEEHTAAIKHSEWSLGEMDNLLGQLRKEKETYKDSLAGWQTFLAKEKQEMSQMGGDASLYANEKAEQVRGDVARPVFERMAYAKRLQRLDPENRQVQSLIKSLSAAPKSSEDASPAKQSKKPRRGRRK